MMKLTKYDIALIGVKLLAIYVGLQVIYSMPNWVLTLSMIFGQNSLPNNVSYPFIFKTFAICLPILALSIPIIMWVLSNQIAQFITTGTNTSVIDNSGSKSTDVKNLQAIIFCAIGIFVFVTTFPELIALLYNFIRAYMKTINWFESQWLSIPKFIALLSKIILSLILIFSADGLSNLIVKLRYAGYKDQSIK